MPNATVRSGCGGDDRRSTCSSACCPSTTTSRRNVRQVPFGGRTIPVLGCTGLAVFKAMFDRPHDWVDIEAMVEARSLDVDEAIRWIREMVGDDGA